jgi:hypothetical protein
MTSADSRVARFRDRLSIPRKCAVAVHGMVAAHPSLMTKTILGIALLLNLGVLAGCAADADEGSHEGKADALAASTCAPGGAGSVGTKGIQFNGIQFNGIQFNGVRLNGEELNGLTLNGWTLNGSGWNGAVLNGVALNGISLNGATLNGPLLQGTQLDGQLSDGSTLPIFVDEVRANPDPKNADVTLYVVSYGAEHQPLCGRDESGAPRLATALANLWDSRTGARIDASDRFTFACQGAALYKCVAAGYKPWKSAELADAHQACTRMIRADYCGDGTSYTKDGTLIDMSDTLGVQSFETTERPDFALEATWGPNGATCVSKTRYRLSNVPSCLADRLKDSCEPSTAAEGGVRLANRSSTANACLQ